MFDFVMKMFSEGDAALPALGMEEIPKQLASQLPADTFFVQYKSSTFVKTAFSPARVLK
jgi:hypothetical protein